MHIFNLMTALAVLLARDSWQAPTSTSRRPEAGTQTSQQRTSASSGSRRLHLLTRPFGEEYRKISKPRRSSPSYLRPQIKSRMNASERGKATMEATTNKATVTSTYDRGETSATKPKYVRNWDRKPEVRSTGAFLGRWERRMHFRQLWNDLNLHTGLEPELLADKVFGMKYQGLHPKSSGMMARKLVNDKKDPAYQARYLTRMQKLSQLLSKETSRINKDAHLSTLEPEVKDHMALDEVFRYVNESDRKGKEKLVKLPVRRKTIATFEKVGNFVRNHFKENNLDFDQMTLNEIEEHTRGLNMLGMDPIHFTKTMYKYAQHQKGATYADMVIMRQNRHDATTKEAKERRRDNILP